MERSLSRLSLLKGHISQNKTGDEEPEAKVHLEIREDIRTAIITWDSPHTLNALHANTVGPLNKYLVELEQDDRVSAVILTGVKNSFCAGANIKQFGGTYRGAVNFNEVFTRDWGRILQTFKKPIIAAINGFWFGGGLEVALMCDIMIASEKAKFGLPEIKLGLIPGFGGTQALIRMVGKSKAMEMILTGAPISAKDAFEYSLVSQVVPHDQLMDAALKLAGQIGSMGLPAIATAKNCVKHAYELPLTTGMEYEAGMFNALGGTEDAVEGVVAFVQKRKPKWNHK